MPILTFEFSGGEEDSVSAFPNQACPKSYHCSFQGACFRNYNQKVKLSALRCLDKG